jgi:hypothetical protein
MGGVIPVKTVWDLTPAKVGSDDAYVSCFMKMFSIEEKQWKRPLAAIRDALLQCASIEEARKMLSELQTRATVVK